MDHSNRKSLTVLFGTLSISLVLIFPGVPASFPNIIGVIMGLVPLALFAALASSCKPWQMSSFFCGLALVMLGIGFFVLLGELGSIAKMAEIAKRFSKEDVNYWTGGMDLWIYSFPVISMTLGVNVISTYISSEPPAGVAAGQAQTLAAPIKPSTKGKSVA